MAKSLIEEQEIRMKLSDAFRVIEDRAGSRTQPKLLRGGYSFTKESMQKVVEDVRVQLAVIETLLEKL